MRWRRRESVPRSTKRRSARAGTCATANAAPGPVRDGRVRQVSAFETLEHLPPEAVPQALRELRRMTRKYVIATIPSFGPNANGPGGWFEVKVRPSGSTTTASLGDGYDGPVAYDDLSRDTDGAPVEGHLTVASFGWWTRQFERSGSCEAA